MSLGTFASQNYQYALDMVPGAACAYSNRQLKKSWSARIMTIRRASDNATTDVFFDSSGKISNSSTVSAGGNLGTWGASTSCFISTWYDQSGFANDIVQATSSAQPQLTNAGAVISPGPLFVATPAVTFLSISAFTQGNINLPITSFAMGEINSSTLGNYTHCDSGNTTPGRYTIRFSNPSGTNEFPQLNVIIGTTILSANVLYLISGFNAASGTTGSVYVNGVFDSSTTAANTAVLAGISLGRIGTTGGQFSGWIPEIIHYGSTLSMTQFQAMNSNIRKFYGI